MSLTRAARRLTLTVLLVGSVPVGALAQRAADPYFEFVLARHLEDAGDTAGAAAALERAAAADPQSAEIRGELAGFYLRRNEPANAEKFAKAALGLDDKNVEGNRVLGIIEAASAEG